MSKSGLARFVPHLGRLGRATRWRRTGIGSRPRIWAHRGDSAHAPENTMLAFEKARDAGADGLEFDVRLDADKHVVVFHDRALDRLAGRPGFMDELSASERAQLRVSGEPVPLLAEVLDAFELELDIEIKIHRPGRGGELVAAVAKVLGDARRRVSDQTIVTSFDPFALVQFHHQRPDIALGYIFHGDQALPLRRGWAGIAAGASIVHPEHRLCTEAAVKRWHLAGMPVNAWTVDDAAELLRLAELGVDGVFANDPGHARSVLG
ncbi:MAG: glycerophosphodiester phosphodiesterase [Kofleriaceae bacterium]